MKQPRVAWVVFVTLLVSASGARAQTGQQAGTQSQNIQAYIALLRLNVRQQKAEMLGEVMQLSAADAGRNSGLFPEKYDEELAKLMTKGWPISKSMRRATTR